MTLAAQLARITGRLRTAATNTGGALQKSMHGIANDIRKISDNLVTADGTGARAISRVDPDAPLLFGQSLHTGLLHTFTPDQVRSVPILSPDKTVVGVQFPSKLRDVKNPMIFTREGLVSASHEYHQYTKGRGREQPKWVYRRTSPAPWGEETVFARAHAQKNGYHVQVKKKIPFTKWSRWVPMRVDGETYGTILAADKHFKQAVKGAPTAELVQMSCSPAAGSAARESAESLQSAGIGFDVHATDKTHIYSYNTSEGPGPGLIKQDGDIIVGHGPEMELNESGDPTKSPWSKYEAPGQRPNTQV
ncbi:hypothetical protein [Nocardia testacea]|uniref:hypothetical protein n=1 Tax=Nocardia testacea TaxID=248551 RepID=UPI003A8522E2